VTLDRNVFAHPRDEIADAEVVSTYVEGELVYHLS
jgi:predicted amidohydrolase YtcJ